MGSASGGGNFRVAGHIFIGTDCKTRVQERQVQVTGDGGPIACCAGLSTSSEMGLFWEQSFERDDGPGVVPSGGWCLVGDPSRGIA